MIKTYTVSWLGHDKRKHVVKDVLGSKTVESMAFAIQQEYGNCIIRSDETDREINMQRNHDLMIDVAVSEILTLREPE